MHGHSLIPLPVSIPDYCPPYLLRNGHANTVWSYLKRKPSLPLFTRETIGLPDGDFIDLDVLRQGYARCAVLIHGLEGDSSSSYIVSLATLLQRNGWDVVCVNQRSCSGRPNLLYRSYHSGVTDDLDRIVKYLQPNYSKLSLVGFSLGGNLVLRYMGEMGNLLPPHVCSAVAVSVPCHLSSASDKMERWENKLYSHRFVVSLKEKLQKKMESFPGQLSPEAFDKIKTLRDFDDAYTGPAHGFYDGEDYYTQCSSVFVLGRITTPTLLINAQDDPYLSPLCFPYDVAQTNPYFYLSAPKYGGHVGFWPDKGGQLFKHEEWIVGFLG